MPAPSPLAIASSSVQRLLKEESTYRTELESQERRLGKLRDEKTGEDDGGNREFLIRQEERGIRETKAVFEPLREKVKDAVDSLEQLLSSKDTVKFDEGEVETAKGLVGKAKALER
ncbi:MAG: hypothetical protein LQ352_002959 [Teloschistes flavicans]|nr:MAG: hypothetical protein LQ352_002959 [Teloschistes flavicans]